MPGIANLDHNALTMHLRKRRYLKGRQCQELMKLKKLVAVRKYTFESCSTAFTKTARTHTQGPPFSLPSVCVSTRRKLIHIHAPRDTRG